MEKDRISFVLIVNGEYTIRYILLNLEPFYGSEKEEKED